MADFNLDEFKKIVFKHIDPKSARVFIFGSRAIGNNLKFSDIDLGILGSKPLPTKNYINLVQAFEDSDIPYRTDVVDFTSVSDKFKEQALNKIIEL